MDIGDVLRRAWQITWKNKGLWVLGILAACTGGGGGGGGSGSYQGTGYQFSGDEWPGMEQFFRNVPEETIALIVVAIVVLAILLGLALFVLGILGQAGLIAGFNQADETGTVTLAEAWRLGRPHFWRLLGAALLVAAVVLVLSLVIAVPMVLFAGLTMGVGLICLLPLLCLVIPLAFAANIYITFVQNTIVVENTPVLASFRRAYEILRANLGMAIVVGLILVVGGFVVGLIIAAPFLAVALPAVLALSAGSQDAATAGGLVAIGCGLVYLPVMLVLNGILQTFVSGTWTLTFRRFIGKAALEVMPVPAPS
ncbi:MAG TPA: hypothetical protein VFI11_14710 [Anaerolineales bacterium]|nr:hypothetical protein [Anaerolineales bacterium]